MFVLGKHAVVSLNKKYLKYTFNIIGDTHNMADYFVLLYCLHFILCFIILLLTNIIVLIYTVLP